ncbi:MAG TPA: RNA polymerase sigma factor [Gemmatimonadaceae bacterium]
MDLTDEALVRRVLEGDRSAFRILVDRHYDRCARFARHMLGDEQDAEEAVQDAFLRAHRSLGRYEERQRFTGWLMRIVVNRCRTIGARRQRRKETFVHSDSAMRTAAAEDPTVDRTAWREEIARALLDLEPAAREAFLLKHVEELSYEEMSEATGVGVSALKMRVKRACDRLRELLQEVHNV